MKVLLKKRKKIKSKRNDGKQENKNDEILDTIRKLEE